MSTEEDKTEEKKEQPSNRKQRARTWKVASADQLSRMLMGEPGVFASLVNGYFFDGKEVVKPEDVGDADTSEIVLPYGKDGISYAVSRWRDVLKSVRIRLAEDATDEDAVQEVYIGVIGCENQTHVDYVMPVRNGLYDYLELAAQAERIGERHRRESAEERREGSGPRPADEFLSGFRRSDSLHACLTIVVFLSQDEWDGPRDLRSMIKGAPQAIIDAMPQNRLNLVVPAEMEKTEIARRYRGDLGAVLMTLKYADDEEAIRRLLTSPETSARFERVGRRAAELMAKLTALKIIPPEGEETVNMHDFVETERQRVAQRVKQETQADDRRKMAEAIISYGRRKKLGEDEIVDLLEETCEMSTAEARSLAASTAP